MDLSSPKLSEVWSLLNTDVTRHRAAKREPMSRNQGEAEIRVAVMNVIRPVDRGDRLEAPACGERGGPEPVAGQQRPIQRLRERNAASSPTGQCVPRKFATPPVRKASAMPVIVRRMPNWRAGGAHPARLRTRAASHALQKTSAGRLPTLARSAPRSTSLPSQSRPPWSGSRASKKAWPAKCSTSNARCRVPQGCAPGSHRAR